MSKRKLKRPSWSPSVVRAQGHHPLDRLAGWISRRSRFVRATLAVITTISFTAAVALIGYNIARLLMPETAAYAILTRPDLVVASLIGLGVVGMLFYWGAWRMMIGFDFGETELKPGRPAAIWLLTGTFVAIIMIILGVAAYTNALQ